MDRNVAWKNLADRAARRHGVFGRSEAYESGLNAQQLRRAAKSGRLRRPLSDVFAFASSPDTWEQRLAIASLAGAVVSHDSAAALHGLDGFDRGVLPIHASFERGAERRLPGTIVHRWRSSSPLDVDTVEGIRCTSIARTLVQLGSNHSRHAVEIALDSALRKGANPAWIAATAKRLHRPGPTGGHVLRSVMDDPARSGALSESLLEKVIERVLADHRLPAPVRQFEIATASGVRRVDLAFPDVRLAIEGHSRRHHFGARAGALDDQRDLELAGVGWEVLYVTWRMAHEPEALLDLIVSAHRSRRKQAAI